MINGGIDKSSRVPIYRQLKHILKDRIESGVLRPGDRIPTERELVQKYKIGRTTVRQAILELVNEGLLRRVRGRGTFVSVPPRPVKDSIGLVIGNVHTSFTAAIVEGVRKVANSTKYQLILYGSDFDPQEENRCIRALVEGGVRGLIIYPVFPPGDKYYIGEAALSLKERGIPFVLIARYYPSLQTDFVVSDNFKGAYKAIEYLIELGHRKIGLISPPLLNVSSVRDRVQGYESALANRGVPVDRSLELILVNWNDSEAVQVQVRDYLVERRPTAVFAVSDTIAANVLKAAKGVGLRIPEGISVVGFDDRDFASLLDPPLTTVRQRRHEIGERAAEILIERIEGRLEETQQVFLPTELIVRSSCSECHSIKSFAG
ncbi:MAG: GntR family transcriptional regulator [bacterium]